MTEQVDLDALIAEARGKITGTWQGDDETPLTADEIGQLQDLYERLADALEAVGAKLRQERERADAYRIMQRETAKTAREMRAESDAALSRAEETIERVRLYCENQGDKFRYHAGRILDAITEYDKQKEQA